MKCFLGHIERWNHDITGGTLIKILSLKIHLCAAHGLDMGDSELFGCHFSTKHKEDAGK